MQLQQAGDFILDKLNKELPDYYHYHNATHAQDVHDAAKRIAEGEGIGEYDMQLLLTAALYHDSGMLYGREDHELGSCKNARLYLPGFDYPVDDIDRICTTIMATKMPQTPHDLLGEIICDADLDYLGRNDFFILSKRLFSELVITDHLESEKEWDELQVTFLQNHHYFTKTAICLRDDQKKEHILSIKTNLTKAIK